ncbi:hypothetical protein BJ742DRAFT_310362 [Cladochytrium replicatum]|nr:hypothetical protein BJ742DRAFT_310362 [Cladochytrium replicatum]
MHTYSIHMHAAALRRNSWAPRYRAQLSPRFSYYYLNCFLRPLSGDNKTSAACVSISDIKRINASDVIFNRSLGTAHLLIVENPPRNHWIHDEPLARRILSELMSWVQGDGPTSDDRILSKYYTRITSALSQAPRKSKPVTAPPNYPILIRSEKTVWTFVSSPPPPGITDRRIRIGDPPILWHSRFLVQLNPGFARDSELTENWTMEEREWNSASMLFSRMRGVSDDPDDISFIVRALTEDDVIQMRQTLKDMHAAVRFQNKDALTKLVPQTLWPRLDMPTEKEIDMAVQILGRAQDMFDRFLWQVPPRYRSALPCVAITQGYSGSDYVCAIPAANINLEPALCSVQYRFNKDVPQ